MRELNLPVTIEASEYTMQGLVEAIRTGLLESPPDSA
jgi:hypothetical protein